MTVVSSTTRRESDPMGDFITPRRKKRKHRVPTPTNVQKQVEIDRSSIPSYGLILFWYDMDEDDIYYLIIQRRDTFEYIDFLRGNYYGKITDMIENMATFEKELLMSHPCSVLRQDMQTSIHAVPSRPLKNISKKKIAYHQREFLLPTLKSMTRIGSDPEFEFPKGRKSKLEVESDLECAVREFREETQLISDLHIISGLSPLKEVYIGTDSKSYCTTFFVARCFDKKPLPLRTSVETTIRRIELVSDEVDNVYWYRCKDVSGKLCDRRYMMLRNLDTYLKNNLNDMKYHKV
jgi:hypothetical protein